MKKTYNNLEIPELPKDIKEIQFAHCETTLECPDECDKCIFHSANLEPFTEWFNKKRYYGRK